MSKEFNDVPLSQSNVTLKLSEIQRRCRDLLEEPEALNDLTLEEPGVERPAPGEVSYNPYDRG